MNMEAAFYYFTRSKRTICHFFKVLFLCSQRSRQTNFSKEHFCEIINKIQNFCDEKSRRWLCCGLMEVLPLTRSLWETSCPWISAGLLLCSDLQLHWWSDQRCEKKTISVCLHDKQRKKMYQKMYSLDSHLNIAVSEALIKSPRSSEVQQCNLRTRRADVKQGEK